MNFLQPNVTSVALMRERALMLLRVFPGRILWLSYPYLNLKDESNRLNEVINKMMRDAVYSISKLHPNPRIQFLNLEPIQSENLQLYSDIIHHPGTLSEHIIDLIFTILWT